MVLTNAERCAKYRTENQEKYKLVAAMQQFKWTKKLASETPEAEKMRKTNLNYDVTVHYKEKTEEINRSIGKLSPLTGALAIHEILIGSDLSIKKKHLPTDPFYKSVQIKESRRKSSVVTPLLDDDEEME